MSSITRLQKSLLLCRCGYRVYEINSRALINLMPSICTKFSYTHKQYSETTVSAKSSDKDKSQPESDVFGTLSKSLESSLTYKARKKKKIVIKKNARDDESDTFGNLSEKKPFWYPDVYEESKQDNALDDDSVLVKNFSKRYKCPKRYLKEMKRLVKENKVKDALTLFVDMRKNFIVPLHPHYTFMIGACGRVGFTEMAFRLLRQMTDRSYQPTCAVLTGLFNACAESPFPEYGLKKAHSLKEKIESKGWQLNQISYHAMIKAFGRCGDISTAFQVVDEMAKADIKIDAETYSFLLMSCIANKESGFTYAVEVWRKMKAKKCVPTVFICNLILRAARDCDIGPEEISCLLLQHWSNYSKRPYGFITKESLSEKTKTALKLNSGGVESINEHHDNSKDIKYFTENSDNVEINSRFQEGENPTFELKTIPSTNIAVSNSESPASSLLSTRPITGPEITELVNIKTPSDRLSLIGGMEGFLKFMLDAKVKPDIKTFTLLLECLTSNIEEEEKLLSLLENYHVQPDIDFFNMLIKKRNLRKETESARNVLVLVNKYGLAPDIVTFGVLALGCRTSHQAITFINEMKKFGSYPNIEITGAMLKNACYTFNYTYMKFVLKLMEEHSIQPNERALLQLEKTITVARKSIIAMEQNKEMVQHDRQSNMPLVNFKEFCIFYEDWLKRMKFESEAHPWLQYDTDIFGRENKENIMQY